MTDWLIIRTDLAKEAYVSHAIARMGYDSWLPLIATSARICRKSKKRKLDTRPLLPKTLFAAIPEAVHGDLHSVEGFSSVWRDGSLRPVSVPWSDIQRFMSELDRHNLITRRHYELLAQGKVSKKPKRYQALISVA